MRWRLFGFAFLFAVGVSTSRSQVYVAAHGSDSAKGSEAAPLATIGHAIDVARSSTTHTVVLGAGVYRLVSPLVLRAGDSGLILKAAPGANVVVSGGEQVQGWSRDGAHGWWKAMLPPDVAMPRQIYVNGVRSRRTHARLPTELEMTATGYIAADKSMSGWRNASSLEMVYTGGNAVWGERTAGIGSWTEPRCPVESITDKVIKMMEPCWTNSTARVMLPNGGRSANLVGPASVGKQPTEIENAYELLGRPGEFYADPVTREIYYSPRKGEDLKTADIEVPGLETLLSIEGKSEAPVHDITVSGITFSYAGWKDPSTSEGFSEIQANFRVTGTDGATKQALCELVPGGTCPFAAWTPEPGNVRATYADRVRFERDTFTHLGAAGLAFTGGAHEDVVQGCIFTDISGNGVELAGVDAPMAPDAQFAVKNRVEDNVFRNVGAEFRGGIPIVVGYARYTEIAHNQIDTIPYAAISIGWGGWLDKIVKAGVANRSTGNVVEKNRIDHFMLVLSDGGGIYTQGRTGETLKDGEVVAGNVVTNQISTGHMLYSDNGSAMMTVRDNVGFGTNFDNWGSRHKDYYDGGTGDVNDPLAITGNWWQQGEPDHDEKQVKVTGNHLISTLEQAPQALRDAAGLEMGYRDLLQVDDKQPPEPPSAVSAFISGSTAYVTWREPVFIGGSAVTSYVVHVAGNVDTVVTADEFARTAHARVVLAHPEGVHRFSVEAQNASGSSGVSLPSREVATPKEGLPAPGEMQKVVVYVSGDRASVHFGMPKDNGEELIALDIAVDDLQHVRRFTGHNIVSLEGRHVTFVTMDGLSPGTHKFGVAAVNGTGRGKMVWVDGRGSAVLDQ